MIKVGAGRIEEQLKPQSNLSQINNWKRLPIVFQLRVFNIAYTGTAPHKQITIDIKVIEINQKPKYTQKYVLDFFSKITI